MEDWEEEEDEGMDGQDINDLEDDDEDLLSRFMVWVRPGNSSRGAEQTLVAGEQGRHSHDRMLPSRELVAQIGAQTGYTESIGTAPSVLDALRERETSHAGWGLRQRRTVACQFPPQYPRPYPALTDPGLLFASKYSPDGSMFCVASQEGWIRLIDTDRWEQKRVVHARDMGWAILDVAYSPDTRFLAYTSWSSAIHLVNATGDVETHESIELDQNDAGRFGTFAARFDLHSTHLICGSSDRRAHLVDLVASKVCQRFTGHYDDINSICFSQHNANLFFTGSDDCRIGVFDRRTDSPSGFLEGHTEGLTCVDENPSNSNFLVSNSKDQSARLWDLRKLGPASSWRKRNRWDYRNGAHGCNQGEHPNDVSLMKYKGHATLITLIRCGFSPRLSGSRFIYVGSADGMIRIYDVLTGDVVSRLIGHHSIVRECSWSPRFSELTSASYDGQIVNWISREPAEPIPTPVARVRRRF